MSQKIYSNLDIKGNTTIGDIANATSDTDKFLVSDAGVVKYRTGSEMLSDLGVTAGTANHVQHPVKAGVAISKGQAVYVTDADGTNMIVGLASNSAEYTSSKTMGLLNATVSTNGFADVITEGLLAGLNTIGATAGDPVWLGTNGNLIYGLVNKPSAPNHLVFIGIVTRVNANNGEIFVKVQNGFELEELHNVDLHTTAPSSNDILVYESSPVPLWKNKTIAAVLGYTPYNASNPNGYISSYTETDPTVPSYVKSITSIEKSNWNTAYSWGNHASASYLTTSSAASTYVSLSGSYSNPSWITALAWSKITGAPAFITSYTETDTLASVTGRGAITSGDIYTPNNGGIFFNGNGVYGSGIFGRNAGQDLGLNAGGLERIRILSTGFTGFGTSNPLQKVHIEDSGAGSLLRLNNTAASWSSTMLYGTTTATAGGFDFIGMYANGTAKFNVSSGGVVSTPGNMQAPIFYDINNTGYYVDPASTSNLYGLTVNQTISGNISGNAATATNANYANSSGYAGNSDTVDGYHASSFAKQAYVNVGYNFNTLAAENSDSAIVYRLESSVANPPNGSIYNWSLWQQGNSTRGSQIAVGAYGGNEIYFRGANADTGSYRGWQRVLHDGNYSAYSNFSGAVYGTIYYDSNNTAYYCDPASTSRMVTSNIDTMVSYYGMYNSQDVSVNSTYGVYWQNSASTDYGIYKAAGAWTQPLHINFYTGIRLRSHQSYGGTQFYNVSSGNTVMGVNNGDNNVHVYTALYSPIMYDENNTGYYIDPNSRSVISSVKTVSGNATFTVGGSVNTFYPVVFAADNTTDSWNSSYELEIYRDNVHVDNGSWGTMRFCVKGQPSSWGHRPPIITEWYYQTGYGTYGGSFVADTQVENFGGNIIVWLRGATTYSFMNKNQNMFAYLAFGNSSGTSWTGTNGVVFNTTTTINSALSRGSGKYINGTINTDSNIWISKSAPLMYFNSTSSGRNAYIGIDNTYDMRVSNTTGGNLYLGSGNTVLVENALQAGLYYDYDNTAFYLNPAGDSRTSNISVVRSGGSHDPYGALSVSAPSGDNYAYMGFTRNGVIGMAMGIDTSNNYWIGSSGGGHNAVRTTTYMTVSSGGTITATADVVAYSDRRVKDNIETIENALDKVTKLRGVTYNRTDKEDKSQKIGVIAQEIQEVLPQVVQEQDNGMLGVSYGNITAVLIEAIKEQQTQIEELKQLVNKLINK